MSEPNRWPEGTKVIVVNPASAYHRATGTITIEKPITNSHIVHGYMVQLALINNDNPILWFHRNELTRQEPSQ